MNEHHTKALKQALKQITAEAKADPNPGHHTWQSWPYGNMAHRGWKVREHFRRQERRALRLLLKKVERSS